MPRYVLKKLVRTQRDFLLGEREEEKKKFSWVSWERVCQLKDLGGLGIKNIKLFKKALLAKSLLQKPHFTSIICYIRRRLLTVIVSNVIENNASMTTIFNDRLKMRKHSKTVVSTVVLEYNTFYISPIYVTILECVIF